jgi:uncharacterized protein
MLTADLAMSWQRGSRIEPRLIPTGDRYLQQRASEFIALFGQYRGHCRQEIDNALTELVGNDPQYRMVRGWAKLLLDRCEFAVASVIEPLRVREAVFRKARELHPVQDEQTRKRLYAQVAEELQCPVAELPGALYGDLAQNQVLVSFEDLSAPDLLDRYNLAQAQALFYRCQQMTITLEPQYAAGYRQLFDAIKVHRLIHTIEGNAEAGYTVTLDGPVSLFHRSQKYGIQMAIFLPALLLCQQWRMRAEIGGNEGLIFYELTSEQKQLRSHYQANPSLGRPDLDKVLAHWNKQERTATLARCQQVLDGGGSSWVPDLVAQMPGQKPMYIELVGFWTPRFLAKRLAQIARTGVSRYVLAASNELRCSREELTTVPPQVLVYKTALDLDQVELRVAEH